jgi:hypothetical protein
MGRYLDLARHALGSSSGALDGEISEKREERVGNQRLELIGASQELTVPRNVPVMPLGLRLIQWSLKEPPVCLEVYSIVTDTTKFVTSTLGQIQRLLEDPKAKVGWSVSQLIDRLAQVGVIVELETEKSSEKPRRRYY